MLKIWIGDDRKLVLGDQETAKRIADKYPMDFCSDWFWDDEGGTWMRLYVDPDTNHILPIWIEEGFKPSEDNQP
jgi:hypothetical protein